MYCEQLAYFCVKKKSFKLFIIVREQFFEKFIELSWCALILFIDFMTISIALFKGSALCEEMLTMFHRVNGHYMWYLFL